MFLVMHTWHCNRIMCVSSKEDSTSKDNGLRKEYSYLEVHDIIYKYQSGFGTIHSTVTALLEATDTWGSQC